MGKKGTYREQKLSDSVFFRLYAVAFCILIPVNILLIVYAVFSFSSAVDRIHIENRNVLQMYVNQLDMTLDEMNTRLYRLTSDSNMLMLQQSDAKHADNDMVWYAARSYIYNLYLDYLQDYPLMDGLYSCVTYEEGNREYIICSSGNSMRPVINDDIMRYVDKVLEENEGKPGHMGLQWVGLTIQGEEYFFLLRQRGNCCFGGWFQARSVLKYWGLDEEEYFFTAGAPDSHSGEKVIAIGSNIGNFSIVQVLNNRNMLRNIPVIVVILILLTFFAFCMVPLLATVTKRYLIFPMNQLLAGMQEVRRGDLEFRILGAEGSRGEFAILTENFNHMVEEIHDLKIEAYEKELEKQRIRMQYLSQQIQPHFILNALNILYCYREDEYPLIQDMLMCLSRYFRYVVKANADFAALGQELEHIRNYLTIQKARYPECFDFRVQSEDGLENYAVPPLLIQNFTENAVKYSVSMTYSVRIDITVGRADADHMRIQIADTGRGFPENVLAAIVEFQRTHVHQECLGVGIQNAVERLEIMYQGRAGIAFQNGVRGGAVIEILLPCMMEEIGEEDI